MDNDFIVLDYKAMKDEDEARIELAKVNEVEKEVKAEAKEKGEKCYL